MTKMSLHRLPKVDEIMSGWPLQCQCWDPGPWPASKFNVSLGPTLNMLHLPDTPNSNCTKCAFNMNVVTCSSVTEA